MNEHRSDVYLIFFKLQVKDEPSVRIAPWVPFAPESHVPLEFDNLAFQLEVSQNVLKIDFAFHS